VNIKKTRAKNPVKSRVAGFRNRLRIEDGRSEKFETKR